jgi:hypothetical protein
MRAATDATALSDVLVGALVAAMNRETRMMVIGLGALLVFGGVLYMVRALGPI